jgi:hypothetical protein
LPPLPYLSPYFLSAPFREREVKKRMHLLFQDNPIISLIRAASPVSLYRIQMVFDFCRILLLDSRLRGNDKRKIMLLPLSFGEGFGGGAL